jgi:hypothetical protein
VSYIKELQDVIWKLHGVASRHVDSVPVKETLGGETVWDGVVEVFDLYQHPKATRAYAWAHKPADPAHPKRHVTVLHVPPVISAQLAVKAAMAQEYQKRGQAER